MRTVTLEPDMRPLRGTAMSDDPIEALYRTEAARLIQFARRKGASEEDAKEIVQEAFFKLARYGGGEKIRNDLAFVRTIIVNLVRDRFRVNGKRPIHVDYDELAHEPASDAPAVDEAYSAQQELELTLQDIASLPDLTEKVFVAHRLKRHSYERIAEDLDITIALVRRHLRDALVHLTCQRGLREH